MPARGGVRSAYLVVPRIDAYRAWGVRNEVLHR